MLYPIELRAQKTKIKFGRGREIRTPDILPKAGALPDCAMPRILYPDRLNQTGLESEADSKRSHSKPKQMRR